MYKIYIELLEKIFWFEFSITVFLTGIMGAYMKLYDKNSWLYKESKEKEWPYNFDSQSSWRTIFIVTFSGAVFSFRFFKETFSLLKKLLNHQHI
jgi:hypothetical protein